MRGNWQENIVRISFSKQRKRRMCPAIFLDRDGILNQRISGGYVRSWRQFKFAPGIKKALAGLSDLGLPMIVVSNQAGIGKGLFGRSVLVEITRRFVGVLQDAGARIDAVYYCPHKSEENCGCRKPQPGLLKRAASDWGVDLNRSILIGDSRSDLEAARAAGCRGILVDSTVRINGTRVRRAPRATDSIAPSEIPRAIRKLLGENESFPCDNASPRQSRRRLRTNSSARLPQADALLAQANSRVSRK